MWRVESDKSDDESLSFHLFTYPSMKNSNAMINLSALYADRQTIEGIVNQLSVNKNSTLNTPNSTLLSALPLKAYYNEY